MFLQLLGSAPMLALAWLLAILIALTVHEFSHGAVALMLGDDTALRSGRLTLNPLAHIDIAGFIAMLFLGFGWAKPVPYNPRNLREMYFGPVLVGLAGPGANLVLALVSGLVLRVLLASGAVPVANLLVAFLFLLVIIDLMLMVFNLIPIPPLDGSKVLITVCEILHWRRFERMIMVYGPQVLLFLVLLSFFGWNVFAIVTTPAFAACDALVGRSCDGLFVQLFGML